MADYFIGVDVGTGSARAGIFDAAGKCFGIASHPIQMWKYQEVFVEQSGDDIWCAVCQAVQGALKEAAIKPEQISGIGFDATCSLVAIDANDKPVSVSLSGKAAQNVIVWMDHRAIDQAKRINATHHKVLDYVGGAISPEMETPKLLWLKENLPDSWQRAAKFFDLPDYLVYRATGTDTRSLCSTVCKWTYMGHLGTWDESYFQQIGLEDLVTDKCERIGAKVRPLGEAVGQGLTATAAKQLGLSANTAVGVSVIDAHAGGIGTLGAKLADKLVTTTDLTARLALISGTSTCHMAVSNEANFVPGVWGPYYSAMIPDMWLAEGGQSATGALIDHIIFSHAQSADLVQQAEQTGQTVYEILNSKIATMAEHQDLSALLTQTLHVLPDFHGNRSPRANPELKGMISGLSLSGSMDELALLYLATIQALAYGTKHIIETMNSNGFNINTIFACGGGINNPLLLREHADITQCPIVIPAEKEAMLLGSAILGAVAAKQFDSVVEAMAAMNKVSEIIAPTQNRNIVSFHRAKYQVFLEMYEDQMHYRKIIQTRHKI